MIYKHIQQAMVELRPGDKIVKVLSNKFCIAKILCTNNTYTKEHVFGLNNKLVYGYGQLENIKQSIEYWEKQPQIDKSKWCFDHSENGKPYHYLVKVCDNRKIKQQYRKLKKLL